MHRVLSIDDDPLILQANRLLLPQYGFEVDIASKGEEGLQLIRQRASEYAAVLVDLQLPNDKYNGVALIKAIREISSDLAIIVYSGDTSRDSLKTTWAAGAYAYVQKGEADTLIAELKRQCRKFEETRQELPNFSKKSSGQELLAKFGMIGQSESMVEVAKKIELYQPLEETVMILGETGVGKEQVAKSLHWKKDLEFKVANCAAWANDNNLADSELFGHEKGSFTGANATKIGILEAANGGTVFLDELHTLSMDTQTKLLRVIQEKKVRKFGGTDEYPISFRLVVATKPNIENLVQEGRFLRDLFYRLNELRISIPELSERKEDIPLLVRHFTDEWCQKNQIRRSFKMKVVKYLQKYRWEGNVRELKHAVRELLINCKGPFVETDQLSGKFFEEPQETWEALQNKHYEASRALIKKALDAFKSKAQAAESLGVSPSTFHSLTKQYKLYR